MQKLLNLVGDVLDKFCIVLVLSLLLNSLLLAEDRFYLANDERAWIFSGKTDIGELVYLPEGENQESWKEELTLFSLKTNDLSLDQYYITFMRILNEKSNHIFQSRIIEKNQDHIIFKWWVDPSSPNPQFGLIKISKTPFGLQFFRYTSKHPEDFNDASAKWEKILHDYTFNIQLKKVFFIFDFAEDGRTWVETPLLNGDSSYYVNNENQQNWTEKLYSRVIKPTEDNPDSYYFNELNRLKAKFNREVSSRIISSDKDSIFFEWWFTDQPEQIRSLSKVKFISPKTAYLITYTIKNPFLFKQKIPVWEHTINTAIIDPQLQYTIKKES